MCARCGLVLKFASVSLFLIAFSLCTPGSFAAEREAPAGIVNDKLRALVADLKARLSISAPVVVSIVPDNPLMMSVKAPEDQTEVYWLTIDSKFFDTLTDEELEAAIAHELGHVWVFTHHPYLQTEELANQIAMRAVSRESLERVYEKVSARGAKGDLVRYLGSVPTAALAPEADSR
jgi:Peptidase family M48